MRGIDFSRQNLPSTEIFQKLDQLTCNAILRRIYVFIIEERHLLNVIDRE